MGPCDVSQILFLFCLLVVHVVAAAAPLDASGGVGDRSDAGQVLGQSWETLCYPCDGCCACHAGTVRCRWWTRHVYTSFYLSWSEGVSEHNAKLKTLLSRLGGHQDFWNCECGARPGIETFQSGGLWIRVRSLQFRASHSIPWTILGKQCNKEKQYAYRQNAPLRTNSSANRFCYKNVRTPVHDPSGAFNIARLKG